MSFFNFGKFFHTVDVAAADASDILAKIEAYVHIAEDTGKTGAEKLAAVKAATLGYVTAAYPDRVQTFDALWTEASAFISGMVSLYNLLGVFVKLPG